MIVFTTLVSLFLAVALFFSVRLNLKQSEFIERFEENYEEAQDVLEKTYFEIENVLSTPVIIDDPVAKRVLVAIKRGQQAVLEAAQLVSMQEHTDALKDKSPEDDS